MDMLLLDVYIQASKGAMQLQGEIPKTTYLTHPAADR
jgi:hypothetical protein